MRVVGQRLARHDHPGRALDGEVAQLVADARPQVLAAALERDQIMERDDHRHRAAQLRSLDPR